MEPRSVLSRLWRRNLLSVLGGCTLLLHLPVFDAAAQPLVFQRKTDLDDRTMADFWIGCARRCWEEQKSTQQNPEFFVRSYCACACSRLAARVSATDIAERAQGVTPKMLTLSVRAAELCIEALTVD